MWGTAHSAYSRKHVHPDRIQHSRILIEVQRPQTLNNWLLNYHHHHNYLGQNRSAGGARTGCVRVGLNDQTENWLTSPFGGKKTFHCHCQRVLITVSEQPDACPAAGYYSSRSHGCGPVYLLWFQSSLFTFPTETHAYLRVGFSKVCVI